MVDTIKNIDKRRILSVLNQIFDKFDKNYKIWILQPISVIFDHIWTILEPISVILEPIYCIVFIEFIEFYGSIRIVFMEGR